MLLLLNVVMGFFSLHLVHTLVSTGWGMPARQSKALPADLGMDVPGQVVMLLAQTELNRKSPLYKPGKPARLDSQA